VLAYNGTGGEGAFTALLPFKVSFGLVSGSVFIDSNGNGSLDPGETPVVGRTVFLDIHNDGLYHADDPQTVTAGDGSYAMLIPTGNYRLLVQTFPGDVITGGAVTHNVVAGQTIGPDNIGLSEGSTIMPVPATSAPFGPGTNSNVQFAMVKGLYNLVLGRAADPQGLTYWVSRVSGGLPIVAVAQALYQSPEYDTRVVNTFYLEFLGRPADKGGLLANIAAMQAGTTEIQVVASLLGSPEYSALHSSNSAYVQSLYQNILGRSASAADLSNWAAAMAGGTTRAAVANAILYSTESLARAVSSLYVSFLAAPPSQGTISIWVSQIQTNGLTLQGVAEQIFGTNEYYVRASLAVG
jgi:hypothetical protein